jgi:hypothetical protein
LTVEGSSSTLGVNYTFGEVRPSLGRRRGRRISTLKDDISTTPGPSLLGPSPGIRLEQMARAGHPEASASCPPRTSARFVASATQLRCRSRQWTTRPGSDRLNLLFEPTHAPRSSPYGTGAGSRASCKLAQGRRSQTAARGACNCPAVTSIPPLSPRLAGERADSHAVGMQPRQVGAPLRLQRAQHGGPGPHVMQLARQLLRASSRAAPCATTAPPRLRNQYRDSRQPCV